MQSPSPRRSIRSTLRFCLAAAMLALPVTSVAQPSLNPGDVHAFTQADACSHGTEVPNLIEGLANASSSCDAASRRLTAQVRPINGPAFVGFGGVTTAFAELTNDFQVAADPGTEGNTVGAWISYDVDWKGRILLVGFLSKPSVELSIQLQDLTDGGKPIKGEMIWARDDDAVGFSIPYVPVLSLNIGGGRDENTVSNTFPAVLKRGHSYRITLALECAVISDGGLDIGTECDYEDNFLIGNSDGGAGWSMLSVKLGLDEAVILDEIAKLKDHTHVYLTGRGTGHNNTPAETGPALLSEDGAGASSSGDLCPDTQPGVAVDVDGCSQADFCALQTSFRSCKNADWNADEGSNPRDCRWSRGSCQPR